MNVDFQSISDSPGLILFLYSWWRNICKETVVKSDYLLYVWGLFVCLQNFGHLIVDKFVKNILFKIYAIKKYFKAQASILLSIWITTTWTMWTFVIHKVTLVFLLLLSCIFFSTSFQTFLLKCHPVAWSPSDF